MTQVEAQAEADRRWGSGILKRFNGSARKRTNTIYVVMQNYSAFCEWGSGYSWKEAFEDCDKRIKGGDVFSPGVMM